MNFSISATEQVELIAAIDKVRAFIENLKTDKDCGSCINFRNDICTIAGVTPPAEVMKTGCPKWMIFDEIPF